MSNISLFPISLPITILYLPITILYLPIRISLPIPLSSSYLYDSLSPTYLNDLWALPISMTIVAVTITTSGPRVRRRRFGKSFSPRSTSWSRTSRTSSTRCGRSRTTSKTNWPSRWATGIVRGGMELLVFPSAIPRLSLVQILCFLLQSSDCMMLAGVRVHGHWWPPKSH